MIDLRGAIAAVLLCLVLLISLANSVNVQSQNCAHTIPTQGGTRTSEPCVFPFRYSASRL